MSRLYARANRNQQQDDSGRLAGASMTPQETNERKCRFCGEAIRNLAFGLECARCRVLAFLCGEKKVNP